MGQASRITTPENYWWDKKDAEKALHMFNVENASYNDIALKFGRTRGAVAGLLSRYRSKGLILPKRGQGLKMVKLRRKKEKATLKISPKVIHNMVCAETPPQRRVRLRLIENDTEVTFAELQFHHCKWPIGDPKLPDFRFCGCNRLEGKPYCDSHAVMAGGYAPPRIRR